MIYSSGDIVVSKHGYDCVLVDFYKVLKTTETMVVLQKIGETVTKDDGYGQSGYVIPDETKTFGNPFRRKVLHTSLIKIHDHSYGRKYDAEKDGEMWFDTLD